jgi:phenylalanyl-tRNA synthetase beta chain
MSESSELEAALSVIYNGERVAELGKVRNDLMAKFDIKQPVFFADLYWDTIIEVGNKKVQFKEISRYPSVERDLAIVVPKTMKYKDISEQLSKLRLNKLQQVRLFDVFESEKLGKDK